MDISIKFKICAFLTLILIHFYQSLPETKSDKTSDNDLIMQHLTFWSLPEPVVHYGVALVWKIVSRTTLAFWEKLSHFFLPDRLSETYWHSHWPHCPRVCRTWGWRRAGPCRAWGGCGTRRGHGTAHGGWGRSSPCPSARRMETGTPGGRPRSSQSSRRSPGESVSKLDELYNTVNMVTLPLFLGGHKTPKCGDITSYYEILRDYEEGNKIISTVHLMICKECSWSSPWQISRDGHDTNHTLHLHRQIP